VVDTHSYVVGEETIYFVADGTAVTASLTLHFGVSTEFRLNDEELYTVKMTSPKFSPDDQITKNAIAYKAFDG
jgi:hypothetical protein